MNKSFLYVYYILLESINKLTIPVLVAIISARNESI